MLQHQKCVQGFWGSALDSDERVEFTVLPHTPLLGPSYTIPLAGNPSPLPNPEYTTTPVRTVITGMCMCVYVCVCVCVCP